MADIAQTIDEKGVSLRERVAGAVSAIYDPVADTVRVIVSDGLGRIGLILLALLLVVAVFGPIFAPHAPFETLYQSNGEIARLSPPSRSFLLGTNNAGQDVLSQLILGTSLAFIVGLTASVLSLLIGLNIGLLSGYFGGWTDQILMRLTDIAFGIPLIPFALIAVFLFGPTLLNIILIISLFIWRPVARVIRAQVLNLKERPFTTAAKASGAGSFRIIYVHIAPNVMPMAFLYMALTVAQAVLLEAGLSFLGFGDPLRPTWGLMLNAAYTAGAMRYAWWWTLPPGIALTIFVVSVYLVTRAYEEVVNPQLRPES